jgi:hypothetical protein
LNKEGNNSTLCEFDKLRRLREVYIQ